MVAIMQAHRFRYVLDADVIVEFSNHLNLYITRFQFFTG